MWTQEEAVFEQGKIHDDVQGAIEPAEGVQEPYIPILIGGGGER